MILVCLITVWSGQAAHCNVTYTTTMTITMWLEVARQDAERRGLHSLLPLLEGLAHQMAALRSADWNRDARGEFYNPPATDAR